MLFCICFTWQSSRYITYNFNCDGGLGFLLEPQLLLYGDDLKIYKTVKSNEDCLKIIDDFDVFSDQCNLNGMELYTKNKK